MITLEENGNFSVRSGDINIFLGIVEEQCKVYDESMNQKLSEINESEKKIRTSGNQVFPPYICTLFAALYLEAFIYDYCARKDSQSLAKSLDKLDPPNKWVIGTKLINGIGIDTSKKSYQDLKNLFQLRNKLAHSKTKNINIENNDDENIEKNNYLEPSECIRIIKEILKELSIIDKDDFYINVTIHRLEGKISY